MDKLLWKKTEPRGEVRNPAYPGDAGFDLTVTESCTVRPGCVTRVNCGVNVALPEGVIAIPMVRSSAMSKGIMVFPTLIDTGYRGPIYLFVTCMGGMEVLVKAGDRIGQLLPMLNASVAIQAMEVEELPVSERGEKGFGSSGGI